MSGEKILTIQDISCVGQCSLTVALPIISACGVETCILPSAVLSTHTGGFTGYTFRDLTDDIPGIIAHWKKEKISFDAVYTGYLGSIRQIGYVKDLMDSLLNPGGKRIVDPAMADNGELYHGFDNAFVREMAGLCGQADVILPNITEASLMTGTEYRESGYGEDYILKLLRCLADQGAKTVLMTGVSYQPEQLGVVVYEAEKDQAEYYFHRRIPGVSHGTGDVYASAFVGALIQGYSVLRAAKLAADFTVEAILKTKDDANHWYGVCFEKALPLLVEALNHSG